MIQRVLSINIKTSKNIFTSRVLLRVEGCRLPYPTLMVVEILPLGVTEIIMLALLHISSSDDGSTTQLSPIYKNTMN